MQATRYSNYFRMVAASGSGRQPRVAQEGLDGLGPPLNMWPYDFGVQDFMLRLIRDSPTPVKELILPLEMEEILMRYSTSMYWQPGDRVSRWMGIPLRFEE